MVEIHWNNDRTRHDVKLETRLIAAVQNPGIVRRGFGEIEPTHLPRPRLDIVNGLEADEMLIEMIINFQRHRVVDLRLEADKAQANGLFFADNIVDMLPGNDTAVKFAARAKKLIEEQNPALGNYIDKVMDAAEKRGTLRRKRQDDLFRRWYANQKRQER